jgi:hypothetical protein
MIIQDEPLTLLSISTSADHTSPGGAVDRFLLAASPGIYHLATRNAARSSNPGPDLV